MRIAIGIDVGGTTTKGGIVDASGLVLFRTERDTAPGAATSTILDVASELAGWAAGRALQPMGAGIGAAGFVDAAAGAVTFSPNIDYGQPNIAAIVSERLGLAVSVDNDANAAVWGEAIWGTARGARDVAMITLGTGLGSGFIVDGHLLRGRTGAAAELGHMMVDPGGPQCPCGLHGCLEVFVSGNAISRLAREAARAQPNGALARLAGGVDQIEPHHVSAAAEAGDREALIVLGQAGRSLGIGLVNVVNLFDPEIIVLGGGVVRAGDALLGPARDEMNRMLLAQRRRPQRVDVTSLGNDAGLIGAAGLVLAAEIPTGGASDE